MYVCMPVHVDSPIRLKQFLVVCTLKYYGNDIIKCSKHKQFLGTFHSTKISGNSGRRSKRTESFWRLFSKILVNPLVPNFQTFFLFYLTFSLGMTWTYKCSSSSCKCCPDQSLQDGGVTKPELLFRVLLHIGWLDLLFWSNDWLPRQISVGIFSVCMFSHERSSQVSLIIQK